MPYEEYSSYTALELGQLVRKGEVTPRQLLDAAIARTKAINPKINAVVTPLYDLAEDQIRRGLPDGPFKGVPFLVKELAFYIKGAPATFASRLWSDAIAKFDDTVVKRFRNAGLVLFGRTNSPEIGLLSTTESALYGTTRNPWNLNRTAGGSSGGSAAAVASGIVPMASGSNGAGSIRIPASCCGLFGLKLTRGRVPWGPEFYEIWEGLVVQHAVTKSVADSAALLDACEGGELGDPYPAPGKARPFWDAVQDRPSRLRVAVVESVLPYVDVADDCMDALEEAKSLCQSLNHDVRNASREFASLFPWDDLGEAFKAIAAVQASLFINQRLSELGRELQSGDVEPITAKLVSEATNYTGEDIVKARMLMQATSRIMARFQENYDIIVTPTLAKPPIEHGVLSLSRLDPRWPEDLLEFQPSTPLANWTGQPAMSVPLYWSKENLPIGVQFFGRFGDEDTLFRLAGQLEREKPWFDRRPSDLS